MNYPLAFQNNSTIFAHETNLSYFSTSPPLHKIGGVLLPETFSRKKFPKIFPPKGRLTFCYIFGAKNYVLLGELFSVFSVRKIMRVRGTCRSANRGGGWLFLPTLYISSRLSFASASGVLHHSTRSKGHRIRSKRGKSKHLFA